MIDEDDDTSTVDLMTFLRPDTSGNRGGNPTASRTLSRAPVFPYDKPVTYGNQRYFDASGPIDGDAPGVYPKNAWEGLGEMLDHECGMGIGGLDPFETELDHLRADFKAAFNDVMADADPDSPSLFVVLADIDPEFAAQTFAPEDDNEMLDIFNQWSDHVAGTEE